MLAFSMGYHVHKIGAKVDRHSDDGPPWVKRQRTKTGHPNHRGDDAEVGTSEPGSVRRDSGPPGDSKNNIYWNQYLMITNFL